MDFNTILSRPDLIISNLLTLASLVSFVIAMIKAIKNKRFNEIKELAIGFIEEAETLKSKNGDVVDGSVKKEIVLSKIRTVCNNLKFKYVESIWSAVIDNYVELTLKVNQRTVDKTKLENRELEEARKKAEEETKKQEETKEDNVVIENPQV